MHNYAIHAEQVSFRIGTQQLLRNAQVHVAPGQLVALVGPNGAGKSSLLKILAGLNTPDCGHIELCGKPIADWSAQQRAARVAYLPQRSDIYWNYRVADVLALGAERGRDFSAPSFGRLWRKNNPAVDAQLVEECQLQHLLDRIFKTLSGGEQARVLLAAALINHPHVLLADEPTASLDVAHQLSLLEGLRWRTRAGLAALVVMHDLNLAARFADHIVMMSAGQTLQQGPTASVINSTTLDTLFGVNFRRVPVDDHYTLIADYPHLANSKN